MLWNPIDGQLRHWLFVGKRKECTVVGRARRCHTGPFSVSSGFDAVRRAAAWDRERPYSSWYKKLLEALE